MKAKFKSYIRAACHSFGGAVCAGAILLLAATMNAQAQYNYTTLSVAGATDTWACAISGNNIVGWYDYGYGDPGHGFLYNGSSYTPLSVPGTGTEWTEAYGISGNNIVGAYWDGNHYQGFLYNGSTYATLSVPGAVDTYACGISGNNIVGWYDSGYSYLSQGFLYNGSSYITLSVPGASWTKASGISGNNIDAVNPGQFIRKDLAVAAYGSGDASGILSHSLSYGLPGLIGRPMGNYTGIDYHQVGLAVPVGR